ncbi:GYF domain-containing protein [Pseudoxanthomonas sp.]|jgi:type IV pilus assembly protein PilA|uniref:GYF domain-containing protein n=1 Tax=Pseudoxanthomonas sp. TaxID=1871049 RepID=UPI002E15B700|nr:GYF domain-containing protein [Pseudoxanthomonas sp.]
MSGWYYADRNREQHGPVSSDELVTHYRFGRVALDSLVWREGLPHWQPLSDFADELGLNPAPVETPGTPPPVPPAAPSSSAATAAPQDRLLRTPATPAAKPRMSGGRIALIVAAVMVVPCIGIAGVLAAIAFPAYHDYTLRSKVAQAATDHVALRMEVKAFMDAEGRCPSNGEGTIGTPESYAGPYVARAVVGGFDDGTCGFELEFANTGNAQIDGRKLWWDLGSDNSEWHCSSEIDDRYLPPDCRG